MSKVFTAQEMREFANYNDAAYARNPGMYSSAVSAALRQAADVLEREAKREKKYEYKVLYRRRDGREFDSIGHADGIEMARETLRVYAAYNDARIVRRPVGEWEGVKDEN